MTSTSALCSSASALRRERVPTFMIPILSLPPLLHPPPISYFATTASAPATAVTTVSPRLRPTTPILPSTPAPTLPSSSLLAHLSRSNQHTRPSSLIASLQQRRPFDQSTRPRTFSTSTTAKMVDFGKKPQSDDEIPNIILETRKAASGIPGEQVEPRQTLPTEDMEPNPANSIKLPPNRQRLIDDVIALYSCQPTVERVARYAPGESSQAPWKLPGRRD